MALWPATEEAPILSGGTFVDTGKVLLFAADAQVGNWLSWPKVAFPAEAGAVAVTGDDLVKRSVFYKVGHHGSRNATRAAALEQMDRSMLVAFSPAQIADKAGAAMRHDLGLLFGRAQGPQRHIGMVDVEVPNGLQRQRLGDVDDRHSRRQARCQSAKLAHVADQGRFQASAARAKRRGDSFADQPQGREDGYAHWLLELSAAP